MSCRSTSCRSTWGQGSAEREDVRPGAGVGERDLDRALDDRAALADQVVHPRLGQVLRASRQSHRALRLPRVGDMPAVIVAPVLVGDDVPAHLLTFDSTDKDIEDDMSLLVTEHAATICGVILGRERVVAAAARSVRDDLVEGGRTRARALTSP